MIGIVKMLSFDRLKYSKIPIWENKRRIQDLTFFRDLYLDTVMFNSTGQFRIPNSPESGQPFTREERGSEVNQRKPIIQKIVVLADISARRSWPSIRKDLEPVDVDVLEQLWYLEKLRVSARAPADVIEEAIGVYKHDQKRALSRTRNPIFWIAQIVEWISESPFWAEKTEPRKVVKGTLQIGVLVGLFGLLGWLLQQVVNVLELLHLLAHK